MKTKNTYATEWLTFRIDPARKKRFVDAAKKAKLSQTELMKRLIDNL